MGGNCKASPWPVWCCQDCHHNHQLPCRLGSTANHTQHTTLFGRFLSNPCFACSCAGRTTTLRTAGTRQLASTMQRNQTYVCQRAVLFMPSSLYTHTHTHAHTHTHTHTHARTHTRVCSGAASPRHSTGRQSRRSRRQRRRPHAAHRPQRQRTISRAAWHPLPQPWSQHFHPSTLQTTTTATATATATNPAILPTPTSTGGTNTCNSHTRCKVAQT